MNDITVVILTYNGSNKDIIATINSVIFQKNINIKLIISDDCSKNFDKTYFESYLNGTGFKDFIILDSKVNRGTVNNALYSLGFVKTKYVKLISQGDLLYDENSLFHIIEFMSKGNYKVAFGKLCGYYEENLNKKCEYYSPVNIKSYLNNNFQKIQREFVLYLNGPCGAIQIYEKNTLYEYLKLIANDVRYCEDNVLAIMLLDNIKIGYYRNFFIWYQVGTGISSSNNSTAINRMRNDQISFYRLLYKIRPSKLTKQAYKLYSANSLSNNALRKISKFLACPSMLLFKFSSRLNKRITIRELGIDKADNKFLLKCYKMP